MGRFVKLKILDRCHVFPSLQPAASAPQPPSPPPSPPQLSSRRAAITSLPLTFFDIPWLFFPPSQPLFFYEYPQSTLHFLSSVLPLLKASLSLALRSFFPLAGTLKLGYVPLNRPALACAPDSDLRISLTVAESTPPSGDVGDDFYGLVWSEYPRDADRFQSLIPALATGDEDAVPLMAVQVTAFSGCGFSIGITYHHVAADERTFNSFLKSWASFCKLSESPTLLVEPPSLDRTVIRDRSDLQQIFLNEWWKRQSTSPIICTRFTPLDLDFKDVVRSTILVGSAHMSFIKSQILAHCTLKNLPMPVHLSPYVLACSFVWVNWVKTHLTHMGQDRPVPSHDPVYFGFIAGGITRLDYQVPGSYFGNCVGFGRGEALCAELVGPDAIVVAASAIAKAIKKLDRSLFDGAEGWIRDWQVFSGPSDLHLMVSGSPKVEFYETDFGWGRPKKIEQVSIDKTRAISLHESRDEEGGIEVGLSLPRAKMDTFRSLFIEDQKLLISDSLLRALN